MDQFFSLMAVLILLLITAGVQIYLQQKEIAKHKKTIKNLNDKILQAEVYRRKNMNEIKTLKWQLENPPKFKIGDKVGDIEVISSKFCEPTLNDYIAGAATFILTLTGYMHPGLSQRFSYHYEYEVLLLSGIKGTKTEAELSQLGKHLPK